MRIWHTGIPGADRICVDVPRPRRGPRFPGGAIDDQDAVLEMVRNADDVDWRLRWALLEVFQLGEFRYVELYAKEYARIFNEVGSNPDVAEELTQRVKLILAGEVPADKGAKFASALMLGLPEDYRDLLYPVLSRYSDEGVNESPPLPPPRTSMGEQSDSPADSEDRFFAPGLFGRQSAISEAEAEVEGAAGQLELGNTGAARGQLVEVLRTVQAGG